MPSPIHNHSCSPHPAYAALIDTPEKLPHAPARETASQKKETATHIFLGTIITMDQAQPTAEAMAIADCHILAVGTKEEVLTLADASTQTIELGDKVIYPGLVESHMHLWVSAVNYDWIDCSAFSNKSLEDIKQRIKTEADSAQPEEWVLGKLFDPSLLEGNPEFTIKDLDPLAPNNPVFILNASMHFAYANSKALALAGITKETPDPDGGVFMRFKDGAPNGTLSEMSAITAVMAHIGKISPELIAANIGRVTDDAAKVGVTTMREAGTGALLGAKEVGLLHHLEQQGTLKTRVSLALLDDNAQKWDPSAETAYMAGNDMVWVGARKIVTDGSNQGESGYQSQPYLGTEERGKLDLTPEHLKERITWCHQNGWQVMVHANGDAAVDITVKTYHEVLANAPKKDLRHRIEHCSLVADDTLFSTMAADGVTPSFLINHVYYWGKTLRDNILGQERIGMLDRTASALKAGLKFTMHSDYNVSPINPLHYVKVAATRTMWDGGEVLGSEQRVSVYDALKAVTIDAAWQMHADDKVGSLMAGKFADFIVLSKDPQEIDPQTIDNILVLETWLNGSLTHKSS